MLKIVPGTKYAHNPGRLSTLMRERDLSIIRVQERALHALMEECGWEMIDSGGFTEDSSSVRAPGEEQNHYM